MKHAAGALAVVAVLGGCSTPGTGRSSAAPPLVVCGTTLSTTSAGPVLADATRGPATVDAVSAAGRIYLLVAAGCDHGADVAVPPGAAVTGTTARARDGRPAAVVLTPLQRSFDVTVAHPGEAPWAVAVRLTG